MFSTFTISVQRPAVVSGRPQHTPEALVASSPPWNRTCSWRFNSTDTSERWVSCCCSRAPAGHRQRHGTGVFIRSQNITPSYRLSDRGRYLFWLCLFPPTSGRNDLRGARENRTTERPTRTDPPRSPLDSHAPRETRPLPPQPPARRRPLPGHQPAPRTARALRTPGWSRTAALAEAPPRGRGPRWRGCGLARPRCAALRRRPPRSHPARAPRREGRARGGGRGRGHLIARTLPPRPRSSPAQVPRGPVESVTWPRPPPATEAPREGRAAPCWHAPRAAILVLGRSREAASPGRWCPGRGGGEKTRGRAARKCRCGAQEHGGASQRGENPAKRHRRVSAGALPHVWARLLGACPELSPCGENHHAGMFPEPLPLQNPGAACGVSWLCCFFLEQLWSSNSAMPGASPSHAARAAGVAALWLVLLSSVLPNTRRMNPTVLLAVPGRAQSNARWVGSVTPRSPRCHWVQSVPIVYFRFNV